MPTFMSSTLADISPRVSVSLAEPAIAAPYSGINHRLTCRSQLRQLRRVETLPVFRKFRNAEWHHVRHCPAIEDAKEQQLVLTWTLTVVSI